MEGILTGIGAVVLLVIAALIAAAQCSGGASYTYREPPPGAYDMASKLPPSTFSAEGRVKPPPAPDITLRGP